MSWCRINTPDRWQACVTCWGACYWEINTILALLTTGNYLLFSLRFLPPLVWGDSEMSFRPTVFSLMPAGAFLVWTWMETGETYMRLWKTLGAQKRPTPGCLCWPLHHCAAHHSASFHGNSRHQWLPSVLKKQLFEFKKAYVEDFCFGTVNHFSFSDGLSRLWAGFVIFRLTLATTELSRKGSQCSPQNHTRNANEPLCHL